MSTLLLSIHLHGTGTTLSYSLTLLSQGAWMPYVNVPVKGVHACPVSCVCSFPDLPHHFDCHCFQSFTTILSIHSVFPNLHVFDKHSGVQEYKPHLSWESSVFDTWCSYTVMLSLEAPDFSNKTTIHALMATKCNYYFQQLMWQTGASQGWSMYLSSVYKYWFYCWKSGASSARITL
jgi:hypothetical protein